MTTRALRIRIAGLVQGVGFRPFIHRIALKTGINGYCLNLGGSEVEIYVEGSEKQLEEFKRLLYNEKPPPAIIEKIWLAHEEPRGYNGFKILKSSKARIMLSQIPPDFAMCKYCLEEILNPRDRRYRYPFNSCAWCGPRFSMLEKPPYDRENTSMRDFPLCKECLKEYNDPSNIRRHHAQGISCPICGPHVWLTDRDGNKIDVEDPIQEAAKLVDEGYIIAVKGLGGFHIAALASSDEVVLELRKRKHRPQKPFAIMVLDTRVAKEIAELDGITLELLDSIWAPIILVPKKKDSRISEHVAPGLRHIGIMKAYSPLHYLLLMETRDRFLIMTSGNPPGEPMCTTNECALSKLRGFVDYYLLHNRRIVNRVDDSVMRITNGKPVFLRRSRGYAPLWIKTNLRTLAPVIAFGAMLQNTGAIGVEEYIIPTQYIGDCENIETIEFLEQAIQYLLKAYNIRIEESVIVSDKHPEYHTTKLAEEYSRKFHVKLLKVQHHHAHIASAMAELDLPLESEVIGIAIDGVGYGDDSAIWGGEVMLTSYTSYKRIGHLEYHVLPGGDRSTLYPTRYLLSILSSILSEEETLKIAEKHKLLKQLPGGIREAKIALKQSKMGRPLTSSTGRFLDAVSSLLGISWWRTYEGEPAIKLEAQSKKSDIILDYPIERVNDVSIIKISNVILQVLNLLEDGYNKQEIAYAVQYWLGYAYGKIALTHVTSKRDTVIVSGGAAVNEYILKGIRDAINGKARVYVNQKVPPGDGGISLGQVAIAKAILLTEK